MRTIFCVIFNLIVATQLWAVDDAYCIYIRVFARMEQARTDKIQCPAQSNLSFQNFPPFPEEWHNLMNKAHDYYAADFPLIRTARTYQVCNWTDEPDAQMKYKYGGQCRWLGSLLADDSLYEHLHGNDFESLDRFV